MGLSESMRALTACQLLACGFFALLFGWYSFQGGLLRALFYFSGFLVTSLLLLSDQGGSKNVRFFLSRIFFTCYTLASLVFIYFTDQQNSFLHLSLFLAYPLLALSLLPFRVALVFVLFFSATVNWLLMLQLSGVFRAVYLTTFWLVTLLIILNHLAYFNYCEALKKQLNRDLKTQLLNSQQFLFDLNKEQERARREAVYLGIIYIKSKESFTLKNSNLMAAQFMPYEGVYYLSDDCLAALLPLATIKALKAREKALTAQFPNLTFIAQLAKEGQPLADYLNPGIGGQFLEVKQ